MKGRQIKLPQAAARASLELSTEQVAHSRRARSLGRLQALWFCSAALNGGLRMGTYAVLGMHAGL